MKIKEGFLMKEVADSYVIVSVSQKKNGFHGMIQINEIGAFFWNQLQHDCTKEQLIEAVLEQYDATREEAEADVNQFIEKLEPAGVFCE